MIKRRRLFHGWSAAKTKREREERKTEEERERERERENKFPKALRYFATERTDSWNCVWPLVFLSLISAPFMKGRDQYSKMNNRRFLGPRFLLLFFMSRYLSPRWKPSGRILSIIYLQYISVQLLANCDNVNSTPEFSNCSPCLVNIISHLSMISFGLNVTYRRVLVSL